MAEKPDSEELTDLRALVESKQTRRDVWTGIIWALAAFAFLTSMIAVGLGYRAIDKADEAKTATGGAGAAGGPVAVELSEYKISPNAVTASASGGIDVTNKGTIEHNLTVKEKPEVATANLPAGGSAHLDLSSLSPGSYTLICSIAGHEGLGMTASLTVTAGGGGGGGAAAASSTPTTISQQAIDDETAKSVNDFLANAKSPLTKGLGGQVMEPTILADGTKEFDLTASVFQWEVAPGKTVEAWGYNGVVPGPTIKVNTGDKLKIVLKNQLPESTSIHWHGIITPNDQDGVPSVTQDPIKPGETYTYQFTAVGPAVGMYHAHQDSQKQVIAGLEGAFLIDQVPLPAGVTLAGEYTEILNDAGNIGFSINGKGFPATSPIVAKTGDYVLVHFMNEGLQIHPMHFHGFSGKVIATDGHPDPAPQEWDTINVAPGQRISILVHADSPGAWLLHCHILTHAESEHGYFGMATAMVVQ